MGGGHWNGKNHGGEHTGNGKRQKTGVYINNGYRREQSLIKLDVGDQVVYTGTNKNKSCYYIPTGAKGEIIMKDNTNKLRKTPRSLVKVNFTDYGIRYVRKDLLQHINDYELFIEGLQTNRYEGEQYERNEKKKRVREHFREENYKRILDNREMITKFRQWRKGFLDTKYLELQDRLHNLRSNETLTSMTAREKELKHLMQPLILKDELNEEEARTMLEYKSEMKDINKYLKESKHKYEILNNFLSHHHKSREYIREVSSRADYNQYLYDELSLTEGVDYKPKKELDTERKKSKQTKKVKDIDYDLIRWGLNPKDVSL